MASYRLAGVVVDAKTDAVAFYSALGFEPIPYIFNLRTDSDERATITSNNYNNRPIEHTWALVPLQGKVAEFITLDTVLDQADTNGWVVVDMKKDWKKIFPDGKYKMLWKLPPPWHYAESISGTDSE